MSTHREIPAWQLLLVLIALGLIVPAVILFREREPEKVATVADNTSSQLTTSVKATSEGYDIVIKNRELYPRVDIYTGELFGGPWSGCRMNFYCPEHADPIELSIPHTAVPAEEFVLSFRYVNRERYVVTEHFYLSSADHTVTPLQTSFRYHVPVSAEMKDVIRREEADETTALRAEVAAILSRSRG